MANCHSVPIDPPGTGPATGERHHLRVPDDAILDAARTCVLEHGVRATTLAGLARTAGVSRMTIYRRFPDVTSALTALMTREFGVVLDSARRHTRTGNARTRLVRGVVTAVESLDEHPLLRVVLDRDATMLLPYVVERLGTTQRHAETFVAELVEAGHTDGSIRHTDTPAQTRAVLLIAQSFALSLRPATRDVTRTNLLSELEHSLDGTLSPERIHQL